MTRRGRSGVYSTTKNGGTYWHFKAKDPETGEWFCQSVSRGLMETLGVEPGGRDGTITERDAQTVMVLFQQGQAALAR